MPEYERSLFVNASPRALFDFVSDVGNMPLYLPTTHHAAAQGEGRVRVQGEAGGHPYDSDGYLRFEATEYRMEWGSDGENRYSGWLEIDGDDGGSEVTVHLSFTPRPEQSARFAEQSGGDEGATIQQGLEAALLSIRNIVEGKGEKVEPPAAR